MSVSGFLVCTCDFIWFSFNKKRRLLTFTHCSFFDLFVFKSLLFYSMKGNCCPSRQQHNFWQAFEPIHSVLSFSELSCEAWLTIKHFVLSFLLQDPSELVSFWDSPQGSVLRLWEISLGFSLTPFQLVLLLSARLGSHFSQLGVTFNRTPDSLSLQVCSPFDRRVYPFFLSLNFQTLWLLGLTLFFSCFFPDSWTLWLSVKDFLVAELHFYCWTREPRLAFQ